MKRNTKSEISSEVNLNYENNKGVTASESAVGGVTELMLFHALFRVVSAEAAAKAAAPRAAATASVFISPSDSSECFFVFPHQKISFVLKPPVCLPASRMPMGAATMRT